MNDLLIRWFMKFNVFLLRATKGRLGSQLGHQKVLLLETLGRKSGQPREIPIAYFFYEGKYLIVASNWGRDHHADWYLNLLKNPNAKLTVGGKVLQVTAHSAEDDEYTRLWEYVTKQHPPYLDYQKGTTRQIPVVVFDVKMT